MTERIILVTGANRGIGFSIIQALSKKHSSIKLLIASRNESSAVEARDRLRQLDVVADLQPIELDVTSDHSVKEVVETIHRRYGRLDVLINNAGIAKVPDANLSDYRSTFNTTIDTNVTSVGFLVAACMPLLCSSQDPRVINVSSGRASITALTTGTLPPTQVVSYSVSKAAMNILTLELRKLYQEVLFQCANPGHCSTGLNGFTGARDPSDGAKVVIELALSERHTYPSGFWEHVDGRMKEMAW